MSRIRIWHTFIYMWRAVVLTILCEYGIKKCTKKTPESMFILATLKSWSNLWAIKLCLSSFLVAQPIKHWLNMQINVFVIPQTVTYVVNTPCNCNMIKSTRCYRFRASYKVNNNIIGSIFMFLCTLVSIISLALLMLVIAVNILILLNKMCSVWFRILKDFGN